MQERPETRGIDLDEVLFETMDGLLDFHNHTLNNMKISREDMTSYHFYKVEKFNINLPDAVERFHTFLRSEKVHDIKPVPGAQQALEKLKTQGKLLVAITGRSNEYREWTQKGIDRHYPNLIKESIFLDAYNKENIANQEITKNTKSAICKEFGATTMVEDDLHYAEELANSGIKVYLLAKPWNKEYQNGMHQDIIKVEGRKEIMNQI